MLYRIHFQLTVGLVLAGLLIFAACGGQDGSSRLSLAGKNVVLISIDTCRADHVQPYRNAKVKTPNLAAIAEEGLWFDDAVSPVPLTLPAHCSLLTGLHPIQHGVRQNFGHTLSGDADTIAELFQESGYATAGVIGSILLSRRMGIDQGFEYFNDEFSQENYQALQSIVERRADRVVESATLWLSDHREKNSEKPFFLFLHFYDPHMQYNPPVPFKKQYAKRPYAGEIAYVDSCIGEFNDRLKETGFYDDTLLVVVGDHGEGLGDHEELTHGLLLYDETVRVPFIVKMPKGTAGRTGKRIKQSVSLEDVVPTLIELFELGSVPTNGISLVPWLAGNAKVHMRSIVLETQYPLIYNWSPLYALRNPAWKYISAPTPELYLLAGDPREFQSLIGNAPEHDLALKTELEDRLIELTESARFSSDSQLSSGRAEALMSLGYAGGGLGNGTTEADAVLPNPKDKIDVYLLIDRGLWSLATGNYPKAIERFEKALEKDPNNPTPYYNLGIAYAKTFQWDRAIQFTRKALERSPKSMLVHLSLAKILMSNGDLSEAKKILDALLEEYPKHAEIHYQLGWIEMKSERFAEAGNYFQQAKYWMPDMPGIDTAIQKARDGKLE